MANNEQTRTLTANTSANELLLSQSGSSEVGINFTTGTGMINYYQWTHEFGRGPSIRTAATADDTFKTNCRIIEVVLTSASSVSIQVMSRPLNYTYN